MMDPESRVPMLPPDRSAGLWRAPGGDGGHGSALGDIVGHWSLVGAVPVEEAEDHRAEAEVDEQDGQRLRDAVAVEVDRVVQQDVAVAGRQVRPDVPPERRQERIPGGPPLAGLPIKMITIIVSSVPAAPISFCNMVATNATTAMISVQIGHTIQNLLVE